jgi:hypothetical protein
VEEDMKRQLGRGVAFIDDVDSTHPQDITVGMPLTVKYLRRGEGESVQTMLALTPAENS